VTGDDDGAGVLAAFVFAPGAEAGAKAFAAGEGFGVGVAAPLFA
jgi:hypothetical protein